MRKRHIRLGLAFVFFVLVNFTALTLLLPQAASAAPLYTYEVVEATDVNCEARIGTTTLIIRKTNINPERVFCLVALQGDGRTPNMLIYRGPSGGNISSTLDNPERGQDHLGSSLTGGVFIDIGETRAFESFFEDAPPPQTLQDDEGEEEDEEELLDCPSVIPSGWSFFTPGGWETDNPLDWFGCSVIKGILGAAERLNDEIDDYLQIDQGGEFSGSDSGVRQAWSSMLTIANVLFVIAFLIMVISTALNLGVVDAYTVKKALPRLIIAAILANLSYPIILLMINFTNDLGEAIRYIILEPVGGRGALADATQAAVGGGTQRTVGLGLAVGLGFGISALFTGGIFVLLPVALAVISGLLVAWAVIMVRYIIILLLVVLAPIAIAFWALPGLDSLEKRWHKMLIQMLMVYPYIIGFIAAGQFVAVLIADSVPLNSDGERIPGIGQSFAIVSVIILPYILLPTVFKLATSTIGNITGMINNKSKGIFDRGSNAARERAKTTQRAYDKQRSKAIKEGGRQRRGSAEAVNRIASGRGLSGWRARRGLEELDIAGAEQAQKKEQLDTSAALVNRGYNTAFAAAQASIAKGEAMQIKEKNGDTTTFNDPRKYALAKIRQEAEDSKDVYQLASAASFLASQKAGGELDSLQAHMLTARGAEGQQLWDQAIGEEGAYTSMKSLSPHLVASSSDVLKQARIAPPDASQGDILNKARVNAIKDSSLEAKATMSEESWMHYLTDPNTVATAAQEFSQIQASDRLKGAMKKGVAQKITDQLGGNNQTGGGTYTYP